MTDVQTRLEAYLNELLPEQLSETCSGCPYYQTFHEIDEGGLSVCGGRPPRVLETHACEATSFQVCFKIYEPLGKLLNTTAV